MQCYYDLFTEERQTAVALGFFDGVHKGHRSVIELAVDQKHNGLLPVCLTFSESPKSVISGVKAPTGRRNRNILCKVRFRLYTG